MPDLFLDRCDWDVVKEGMNYSHKGEIGFPRIFAPSQLACITRLQLFCQIHDVF